MEKNMKNKPITFQQHPDEAILYRSEPSRKWYVVAWKVGLGILEAFVFILLSTTTFFGLAKALLETFLPVALADGFSRVIFQGIAPLVVIAWVTEDTAGFFTRKLILTSQRIWTKGIPYAWSTDRDIPLSDIKSITPRRDALFLHRRSTHKTQVLMFPDSKLIAEAFAQFTRNADAE
jgi:hypothetical protein